MGAINTRIGIPLRTSARQASYLRPEDQAVHVDRNVLLDASPAVRQRSRRDDVLQRIERSHFRMDRHQGLRPDHTTSRRRWAGAARCWTPTATERSPALPGHDAGTRAAMRRFCIPPTRRGAVARRARPAAGRSRTPQAGFDPKLDTLVSYSMYAVIPSPVDDSVWGVAESPFPGMLVRLQRGNNPPESCKTQLFKVPAPGYDPRGVDIDSNGVVWTGSGRHQPSGQLRRSQVQRLERSGQNRWQPVQGRLDALSDPRPQAEGHGCSGRFPLLQLGGSAQRHGAGREHAVPHRVEFRLADCAESRDEEVDLFPHPLSARLTIRAAWMRASTTRPPDGKGVRSIRTTARISSGILKAEREPRARS